MPFNHPDFDGVKAAVLRETAPCARPAARHPDDVAVDALAALMKAKLAKQRAKGYGGWDTDCTQQRLSDLLRGHVDKGDPVDVANFCAFLVARGEGIAAKSAGAAQAVEPVRYPDLPASAGDVVDFQDGRGVDIDWASPAPPGGTSLYSADQMRAYVDADRAARAPQAAATQAVPVLWVSPGQLEKHADRDEGEGGNYLPCRKTQDGNFTMPLYDHSAPAAQEGQDARQWLQVGDMEALARFAETTDDDQSYDIGKEAVKRLAHFGCVESHGFGRYGITAFGSYVLGDWSRARELPFKTQADRDAEHRAAIAAQAAQGGA